MLDARHGIRGAIGSGLLAALVLLIAGGATAAATLPEELFVSNYSTNTISVYPRTVSGDVAPIRTIQTGVNNPHQIAIDLVNRELFVASNSTSSPSVVVYDLNASYPLNDTPKRIIAGAATGLTKPTGVAVDMVNRELYVTNDVDNYSSIVVFPLSANGDVAPIRTIQGTLTRLNGPVGLFVDHLHDELLVSCYKVMDVADYGTVSAFPRAANGNVAPLRLIGGHTTFLREPQALALDLERNEIAVAVSLFDETSYFGAIMFYNRTDVGDVYPAGEIFGTSTGLCNPIGLVLDRANDEYFTANSHFGPLVCDQSVTSYKTTPHPFPPDPPPATLRTLVAGPASGLSTPVGVAVTGNVRCSDPSIPDGIPCDDGNACTRTDVCQGGVCVGSNPVVCTASDACHAAGTCTPATGLCSNPNAPNGVSCSDGSACTRTDTCQNGVCAGSNPVVCTASDQCHIAGTCNPGTGLCSNPVAPDSTPCNDGDGCTRTDSCQGGACVGSNPVVCTASDQCHIAGTCSPSTGLCSNPIVPNGTSCSDGSACTQTDTCQNGTCAGSNPVICTASDQCHIAGTCNPGTGLCSNPVAPDNTLCNDGDGCTRTDRCAAGSCVGSNPVVCTPMDACHVIACNPATGQCVNTNAPNGTSCNDANACTQTDTCHGGLCVGSNPVVCTASDACHVAGSCNPDNGLCSNPVAPDNTPCNDGSACTQPDTCIAGACVGSNPVLCNPLDACHVAACNPATGQCVDSNAPNGTPCNDANACTQTDTCQNGACVGSNPVVCTASDACHLAGTCNPVDGLCSNPLAPDNTPCSDADGCTQTDACISGVCVGSNPVVCAALDACHVAGVCNSATGLCSNPAAPDETPCDDGSACTPTDRCIAGACVGSNPVVCPPLDACHPAECNPSTGQCANSVAPNGTPCNDSDPCTQTDTCVGGACVGSNPVVCAASDACHLAGTCNPASGLCSNPVAPDNTPCSDGDACTRTDTCVGGACAGSNPVVCTASDACHLAGTCNPASGLCSNPVAPDSTPCNDSDPCTRTDACVAGICSGSDPVVCTASDACHIAGVCNPASGLCSNPRAPDGTLCNDGNICTVNDACSAGTCIGVVEPPREVNDSLSVTKTGVVATIAWSDSPGPFHVYRGLRRRTGSWSYNQTCFDPAASGPSTDAGIPDIGSSYYYLVSRKSACGQESVLGRDSFGTPATNLAPCP